MGDGLAPGSAVRVGAWVAGCTKANVLLGIGMDAMGGVLVAARPWQPAKIDAPAIINTSQRYI